ncbi:MAG TPA: ORF6N domain-containing protein [Syntrophorhabdaceae bacterium]|nr:ORF6N domain-containing protein [Syntrophorhabdaceae bacterium]
MRGQKVMLDRDLAMLYGVETRVLNQAVRRNIERFPEDFMFQLTKGEMDNWKSQIVISNKEKMGLRRRPYAFTENGVAMLSSVLNSSKAIQVNIQTMRTFTKIREMIASHKELAKRLTVCCPNRFNAGKLFCSLLLAHNLPLQRFSSARCPNLTWSSNSGHRPRRGLAAGPLHFIGRDPNYA